jgi:rhodanese-related sulfurtransferase
MAGPIKGAKPAEGYSGEIDSADAYRALEADPAAVLIDVRTEPEWEFVGRPDLSPLGREPALVCWQIYPGGRVNQNFVEQVRAIGIDETAPVFVICRSGARSRSAAQALTEAGFAACYNVSDGFEGPKDETGHRGTVSGWRKSGLPWTQG